MDCVSAKKILKSEESWKKEFKKRYGHIKHNINDKNCLRQLIRIELVDDIIELPMSHYVVNLMMWQPMIKLKLVPSAKTVMNCNCITKGTIKDYIDNVYIRPFRSKVDIETLNIEIAKIIEELKNIVKDFGVILGITYNYYQIGQLCKKSPRFKELLYTKIPKGLQPKQVEEFCKERLDEAASILRKSNTGFAPLINSGGGISLPQLQELLIVVGNKPDLDGNTYSVPINTNIMIGGLNTPAHYTLDSTAGRKALIMNKKYTGNSGYFSRKLNLLSVDTALDPDPESDCHTKHYLKYKIDDMDSLLRLEGRHYKRNPKQIFEKIITHTDTKLIGQTIYLRSPCLCANEKICRKCYGELYIINKNINVGLMASTTMTNSFTQNILSAKHSLMTKSQKIEFDENIDEYFLLDGNRLVLDLPSIPDKDELYITIYENDIEVDSDEVYDEEGGNDSFEIVEEVTCSRIFITTADPSEVLLKVTEKNSMSLKLSEETVELINKYSKGNRSMIPLKKLDDDAQVLGTYDVSNFELTKTLNEVKGLLEREDHNGITNIEDLIYRFNRLLIDGKIYLHLVHAEVICRNIIRNIHDNTSRPDFTKDKLEYNLLTVKKALMANPSPLISLSFERVEEQLRSVLLFKKRKSSMIDRLFMLHYDSEYDITT